MTFRIYKYRIPFSQPLETSKSSFRHRSGFILEATSDNGKRFLGEAAPLPGFSGESIEEVESLLLQHHKNLSEIFSSQNIREHLNQFREKSSPPPSILFALDCIACQMNSHKEQSIRDLLFSRSKSKVQINALGNLHAQKVIDDIRNKIEEGFQTFKFKMGINFERELQTLKRVRSHFSNLTIRLDANQSWGQNEALQNLQKLQDLNIEYCEEPLKKATPNGLRQLSENTEVPLALDESLPTGNEESLLPFCDFVVIKPMLWGSFDKVMRFKELADRHKLSTIFTTTLETGIGRMFTTLLASGLGSPNHAHGLATGDFLLEDIISFSDCILEGYIDLSRMERTYTHSFDFNPERSFIKKVI